MAHLPILMYHNVSQLSTKSEGLTIGTENLEKQFKYLVSTGYKTVHFHELDILNQNGGLPKKTVIITFDDVYVSQLELAYPLLKKHGLKASFFIPFAHVNASDSWNKNTEKIMSVDQLKSLDTDIVELGWHSFQHKKYDELSNDAIIEDFKKCNAFIAKNDLKVQNILAYPFGKFPRKEPRKSEFFNILKTHNIDYALRIGNRVNRFPFKNNYEIKRIDIKGDDTFTKFKLKLKFGKLKLF